MNKKCKEDIKIIINYYENEDINIELELIHVLIVTIIMSMNNREKY